MAISIDTVYQKVLVLANKEQRGYITPQEFNLLADKAQNDIFESYFNLDSRKIDKKNLDGDNLDLLPEKLDKFYQESSTITDSMSLNIPTALYKLRYIKKDNIILTEISKEEIFYIDSHPLTKPTTTRPAFVRYNDSLVYLYPAPSTNTSYMFGYWKRPSSVPNWSYVVVNGKALYNSNASTNFELHDSEEEMLVTRILELAGIVIEKPQLHQTAMVEKAQLKQEQIR
jgi:hypothetical protein